LWRRPATGRQRSGGRFVQDYGVQLIFLLMRVPVFLGIFTFRRYIIAAHQKVEAIIRQLGYSEDSPIPAGFCQWMTDLMAAGYLLSYFILLSLLFMA
jgi:hypothetical protein